MTGRPAVQDHWVVCDDYAAGPYAQDRAEREVKAIARLAERSRGCPAKHRIVVSATKPPTWEPPAWGDEDD